MPLLRSQLRSEASGSERGKQCGSYATLGCGGLQRGRRQNAYATLCANFHLTPLPGTAFLQEPPLLPLLPSVNRRALWLRLRRPALFTIFCTCTIPSSIRGHSIRGQVKYHGAQSPPPSTAGQARRLSYIVSRRHEQTLPPRLSNGFIPARAPQDNKLSPHFSTRGETFPPTRSANANNALRASPSG
jgi:hypothetical protein